MGLKIEDVAQCQSHFERPTFPDSRNNTYQAAHTTAAGYSLFATAHSTSMSRAGQARPVPTRSLLVRDIQILATLDPELGDIRNAAIYVEGNVIKWVGASCDIPKTHATAEETISLPDRVLIPGLVNTHHHMFQCLTRCLAQVCVSL